MLKKPYSFPLLSFLIIFAIVLFFNSAISGWATASTEAGPTENSIKKKEGVGELFKKPKPELEEAEPVIEHEVVGEKPVEVGKKFLVKEIVFSGNRVISSEYIEEIIFVLRLILSEYKGEYLSLQDLQKMTSQITNLYRTKGYITSRAYLPPQDISDGIVEIKILEGEVGEITVEGQKYFKESLIKQKIVYEMRKELIKEEKRRRKEEKRGKKAATAEARKEKRRKEEKVSPEGPRRASLRGRQAYGAGKRESEKKEREKEAKKKAKAERKAKKKEEERERKEWKRRAKEEAKGAVFNYSNLERGIRKINRHPDRTVKAILSPGEEPKTTDILLKVKDRSPWHFYTEYNNRGTRYTGKNRYGVGLSNTNLFGRDDFLSLKFLMGEEKQLYAYSLDYNFPVNMMGTRLGFYGSHATLDIGKEFAVLDVEGRATSYGVYLGQPLWDTRRFGGNLSLGFDIKSIKNFMLDEVTSHDELRVFKFGLSLDEKDNVGRTFFTNEFHFGIPEIFGGSRAVDDKASRLGAGGKFKKYVGSLSRVQKLPLYSLLIGSVKGQATWDDLVSAEQIAMGGADTVRGYPELESLGDYGYIVNAELRTPPFLFPYFMKIKDKVQFVFFTDIGKTTLKSPAVGEDKSEYLRGAGLGIRIDIPDRFSGRVDCGFPLGKEPSDGSSATWHIGAQIKF